MLFRSKKYINLIKMRIFGVQLAILAHVGHVPKYIMILVLIPDVKGKNVTLDVTAGDSLKYGTLYSHSIILMEKFLPNYPKKILIQGWVLKE